MDLISNNGFQGQIRQRFLSSTSSDIGFQSYNSVTSAGNELEHVLDSTSDSEYLRSIQRIDKREWAFVNVDVENVAEGSADAARRKLVFACRTFVFVCRKAIKT